jgi:hypothetical protein
MTRYRLTLRLALCAAGLLLACRAPATKPELAPIRDVPARELCLSIGRLHPAGDKRWVSTHAALRATAPQSAGHHAAVVFRYLGGTETRARPAAEVEPRQLGLKLLSRDSCNAVYAMWRFDEGASVVATVQANPAFARHSQCGNRGYRSLRPFWTAAVEPPRIGSIHELSATVERGLLEVMIDGRPVLHAVLAGHRAPAFGASGLRGDNVGFELIRFEADVPETGAAESNSCG